MFQNHLQHKKTVRKSTWRKIYFSIMQLDTSWLHFEIDNDVTQNV